MVSSLHYCGNYSRTILSSFRRDIVLDQNWLRSLEFYVNSRHTGGLETIHSLMLAYCPKHIGKLKVPKNAQI